MSEADAFVIEDDGAVRHLILNRPDKLNALDLDQHVRIKAAVEEASADASVRALVLSGNGRAFCAGDDLRADAPIGEDPLEGRRVDLDLGTGPAFLLESAAVLRACPKPTVVLLHGHALGSGYDYSLSCDFRLATEDVNYGDPRIHRALWAAEGWSYKLPKLANLSLVTPGRLSRPDDGRGDGVPAGPGPPRLPGGRGSAGGGTTVPAAVGESRRSGVRRHEGTPASFPRPRIPPSPRGL